MKKFFVLLTMLSLGCAREVSNNNIDPAFQPLYDQFIEESAQNGRPLDANQGLTIQFTTLEQKTSLGITIGSCDHVSFGHSTISIDRAYWNSMLVQDQFLLLYHELGHCVLAENHVTDPTDIMFAVIDYPTYNFNMNPSSYNKIVQQLFAKEGDGL